MIKIGDTNAFTLYDLARMFNTTPTTARKYLHSGQIAAAKFAGKWFITEDALKDFFMNRNANKQDKQSQP